MNIPERGTGDNTYEKLLRQEEDLRTRLMQGVLREYGRALLIDGPEIHYLQGMEVETPIPTVAFREDSKSLHLGMDSSIGREKMYVYVPADSEPDKWIERTWIKKVSVDGRKEMFQIDENGFQVYESKREQIEREIDQMKQEIDSALVETDTLDIDLEDVALRALEDQLYQKRTLVDKIQKITDDLGQNYELVPFDS